MGLFTPLRLGDLDLPNRIVMAPLGRARNDPATREPGALSQLYYAQRASAGLIIAEATHVSPGSISRPGTGAIHTTGQITAWRRVTDAVHAQGGRIVQQLFHLGRKADPARRPGGLLPVAPSAIAAQGTYPAADGTATPFPVPRAALPSEIPILRGEFSRAIRNSRAAGFDGVELHAANGFLIEQFLRSDANQRKDDYGGSIPNRARFLLEVVDDAIATFGKGRVGVRISPHFRVDGPGTNDAAALYTYVADELGQRGIAYLHLIEPDSTPQAERLAPALKAAFGGPLVLAADFTRDSGEAALDAGRAEAIAYGRLYIANPDLVERFALPDAPLNAPDEATFHNGGAHGYTDYPRLTGVTLQTA